MNKKRRNTNPETTYASSAAAPHTHTSTNTRSLSLFLSHQDLPLTFPTSHLFTLLISSKYFLHRCMLNLSASLSIYKPVSKYIHNQPEYLAKNLLNAPSCFKRRNRIYIVSLCVPSHNDLMFMFNTAKVKTPIRIP